MTTVEVHEAQISTATVEIKTLTVRGKQVTLALFRQLREEPIDRADRELWGTVNYHSRSCPRGEHWHAVWQKDEELRKALVEWPLFERYHWSEHGEEWLIAAAVASWAPAGGWSSEHVYGRRQLHVTFVESGGLATEIEIPQGLIELGDGDVYAVSRQWVADHAELLGTQAELAAWIRGEAKEEMTRRATATTLWERMSELPQLFIAV